MPFFAHHHGELYGDLVPFYFQKSKEPSSPSIVWKVERHVNVRGFSALFQASEKQAGV